MKAKNDRLDALKVLISTNELGNQRDVRQALSKMGSDVTQATLSRDMKQLKVAKAASMNGKYVYVLPNETMYKRVHEPIDGDFMMKYRGFESISFSGNMCVIKTRPGYASSIAYNIDNSSIPDVLGTIAGDDTIFIVLAEDADKDHLIDRLYASIGNN